MKELLKKVGILSHSFVLKSPAHPTVVNVGRVLIEAGEGIFSRL